MHEPAIKMLWLRYRLCSGQTITGNISNLLHEKDTGKGLCQNIQGACLLYKKAIVKRVNWDLCSIWSFAVPEA